ncbi:MAG: radical SAM protein [Candidatus Sumerlaeia bacterium]|nr:radical SAM protein [Candidatus Sumerlaeia bacterium]
MPPVLSLFQSLAQRIRRRKLRLHVAPDFPIHAQIETVAGCNANCIFCPNRKTNLAVPIGRRMDRTLYERLVDELIDGGVERISPYLSNEPLLDPDLPERIAYVTARKHKGQYTKINSNGSLLTETMAKRLLDSGLDRLNFSVHGIEPDLYEKTMGLKLDRVLANIDRFLDLKRAGNYDKPRVRVVMLVTKILEPQLPKIREYWGARGVKLNLNQLENRGNHPAIQSHEIAPRKLQFYSWCNRLFDQVYIAHDGRLIMCCADWEMVGIMGDATQETIRAIWNGPVYQEYRRRFLARDLKGMLCARCTKDAVGNDDE